MADYVPFEILTDIFKRLPVKSLIQFRSVSKQCKSLIDSSEFIAHHQSKLQHMLVSCENDDIVVDEIKYVSLVDDDTFPQQKVSVTIPLFVSALRNYSIIGSCRGLVCLFGDYQKGRGGQIFRTSRAVMWNPSIRKAVAVVVPNVMIYGTYLGFGVCHETNDPKIVKITCTDSWRDEDTDCIPWQVEVFTLSTGAWRCPYSTILLSKSIRFVYFKVVKHGVLYWLATNRDERFGSYNLIIAFDMTSEEFREVNLPHSAAQSDCSLSMHKLRESLVVLESDLEAFDKVFNVWIMEDGVSTSFTKLFTIDTGDNKIIVRGFRNTGEPIIEVGEDRQELAVYEPYSKCISNLGVNGMDVSFSVYSYMETLLLLDQPDFTLYAKGKRCIAKPRAKAEGF